MEKVLLKTLDTALGKRQKGRYSNVKHGESLKSRYGRSKSPFYNDDDDGDEL